MSVTLLRRALYNTVACVCHTQQYKLEVYLFVANVPLSNWKRSSVEVVVPPRRGFTIASSNGRPLMMMDAAVVENHGIVPGDIPTSDLGPHLQAPLSP